MSKSTKSTCSHPLLGRYVLVTTVARPWTVVVGTLRDERNGELVLADARMIVYYSPDACGLFGAAAHGPGSASRVSAAVDVWIGRAIEQVVGVTPEARALFEAGPWK